MYYFYEDYCKTTKQKERTVYENGKEARIWDSDNFELKFITANCRDDIGRNPGFHDYGGGRGYWFLMDY